MRTFGRAALLCALFCVAGGAALARPRQQQQQPSRDERCEVAKEYARLFGRYNLEGARRAAWVVAEYEGALSPAQSVRPCDVETRGELYAHFLQNYKQSPERQREAAVTAREYLCRCAGYDDITLFPATWMRKYDGLDYFYPDAEAAAAAIAREDAQRPRCRCDEMREQLVDSLKEQYGHEHSQQNHETVKKFLNICGDLRRPIDRYLNDWLTKYDRAVRDFEGRERQGGGPRRKARRENDDRTLHAARDGRALV